MDFHLEQITREFQRRGAKNPRYSLRAFASFLNLDPSALSRVLAGKQELSVKSGMIVLKKLQLNKNDSRRFMQSLIERRRRNEAAQVGKQVAAPDLRPVPLELTADVYARVASLPYLAFLELVSTEDFSSDSEWIAKRLGMDVEKTSEMIETLIETGLLKREESKLVCTNIHMTAIQPKETNAIRQGFQERVLNEGIRALKEVPFERRAHYGMTMAIDASKIGLAQQRIREFIEMMNDELSVEPMSEVYQLAVQFFPLTTSADEKGAKE